MVPPQDGEMIQTWSWPRWNFEDTSWWLCYSLLHMSRTINQPTVRLGICTHRMSMALCLHSQQRCQLPSQELFAEFFAAEPSPLAWIHIFCWGWCLCWPPQWLRNFLRCLEAMPANLCSTSMPLIWFKVPKFHLLAHQSDCHSLFSFNFMPGIGHMNREGVERNWSWLNGTVASTSQMRPGSWMDTLDDFMGFHNYQMVINFGKLWCLYVAVLV